MEDLYDPEEKILCPYNNSHHIRRCKMSFHLVKCKQNYGEQILKACDFNATHMIPEPELQYHHQTCPDRKKIEARIVDFRVRTENKYPVPKIDVPTEENWDDNCYPTYDPKQYVEKSDVLRHLDVVSGAKRKNFRKEERLRLGELSRQNEISPPVPESSSNVVQMPPRRPVPEPPAQAKSYKLSLKERLRMGQDKVITNKK